MNKHGFSILELLIAVAIITLIAGIAFPEFRRVFTDARRRAIVVKNFQMSHEIKNAINVSGEPILYLNFDEGAGATTTDKSGNKNHGTIYGAAWTDESPHKAIEKGDGKWALQFDGINDRVGIAPSAPLSSETKEMTVEAWVYPLRDYGAEPSQWYYFVWWDAPSGYKIEFGYEGWGDQTAFKVFNTSGTGYQVDTGAHLQKNQWYYFVGAIDQKGNMVLYRNGQVIDRKVFAGTIRGGEDISIGARTSAGYFNGVIDEVKIYNRTFSIASIKARYFTGLIQRLQLFSAL